MEGISWTDLDSDEQRALAMLAEGASTDLCDPVALLTLRRIGLVRGSQLTLPAEQMLSKAVRNAFAAGRHFSKKPAICDGCQSREEFANVTHFAGVLCVAIHTCAGKLFELPLARGGART